MHTKTTHTFSFPFNCSSLGTRYVWNWWLNQMPKKNVWCISNAPFIERNTQCPNSETVSIVLIQSTVLLFSFLYLLRATWCMSANRCDGRNCSLRNNRFGNIIAHTLTIVCTYLCLQWSRSVIMKCADGWKKEHRLWTRWPIDKVWRLIKSIRFHIRREWRT